jgi:hypothetical protein
MQALGREALDVMEAGFGHGRDSVVGDEHDPSKPRGS